MLYVSYPPPNPELQVLRRRLKKAQKELELSLSASFITKKSRSATDMGPGGPSSNHELKRMRIERGVKEANFFFSGQLRELKKTIEKKVEDMDLQPDIYRHDAHNNDNSHNSIAVPKLHLNEINEKVETGVKCVKNGTKSYGVSGPCRALQ
jgi:hypothetical protein